MKNKLISSFGWKFSERFLVQVINLVIQIFLARLIAPQHFGNLSLLVVIYNIADIFVQKGLSSSLIRKSEVKETDLNTTFWVSFAVAAVLYIAAFFLAPSFGAFFGETALINPLRVLLLNLLIAPMYCVCNAILVRNMEFKTVFVCGVMSSVISGIIGIAMAYKGFGLWALVAQTVSHQAVLLIAVQIKLRWKPGFSMSKDSFKEIFEFGKNVLITELMLSLVESLRSLLIGKKYSEEDLAYYDRGQIYPATLMRAVNDTLFSILLPYFSKEKDSNETLIKKFHMCMYYTFLVLAPVFLGFACVGKEFVLIFLTDKWLPAVNYITIFCIYQVIFPVQIICKILLYAKGNSKIVLKSEIVKSVLSFTLMIIAMFLGVEYIAASLIIVRLTSDCLYYIAARKEMAQGLNIFRDIWRPAVASAIMIASVSVVNLLELSVWYSFVLKLFVGVISYSVSVIVLDRTLIKTFLKRR